MMVRLFVLLCWCSCRYLIFFVLFALVAVLSSHRTPMLREGSCMIMEMMVMMVLMVVGGATP